MLDGSHHPHSGRRYRSTPVEFADVARAGAREHGWRAAVAAPMLREGDAIGSDHAAQARAGAFTARQIELLETFAAQAVIAIENVRLFTELRESLEQQTATAEILRVISQSPTDVAARAWTAVAKAAVRFCGAEDAHVFLRDGDEIVVRGARRAALGSSPGPSLIRSTSRAEPRAMQSSRRAPFISPIPEALDPRRRIR